jgi:NAD(P)-dependent dehydrogenase (short-subunit alcohol dehydrogenase family)
MFWSTWFDPNTDMPSLVGKTILVTGGNSGLGKESVRRFAQSGAKVVMAARNRQKAQEAIDEIKGANKGASIAILELDLADLASVNAAARRFLQEYDRLDILMNSGGVMAMPEGLTKNGYEIQFGTNHLGHALLTNKLLPLMLKTAGQPGSDVRIVNLTSIGQEWFSPKDGIMVDQARTTLTALGPWGRYGHSKVANILFTKGLAIRYPQIKSVAIHPGPARTNLSETVRATAPLWQRCALTAMNMAFSDVSKAVRNQLWASVSPSEQVKNGAVYYPVAKEHLGRDLINNPLYADNLWTWTESELAVYEQSP